MFGIPKIVFIVLQMPKCSPNAAQMRPNCGPIAARMWPEDEILQPEMNPGKFSVARARPEPKPQAQNPTRTMKKVAQPSPKLEEKCKKHTMLFRNISDITLFNVSLQYIVI